jgi:hypothetical protein
VVDTTGTFDVLRLHEAILTRSKLMVLTERARQIGDLQPEMPPPPPPNEDAEKLAEKALERVKILRVFDFVGVMEAVDELSEELRSKTSEAGSGGFGVAEKLPQSKAPRPESEPRTEVADSDEEDEEDMLFETPSPVTGEPEDVQQPKAAHSTPIEKIGMIVVDNISQVANPILKINYVRGNHAPAYLYLRS